MQQQLLIADAGTQGVSLFDLQEAFVPPLFGLKAPGVKAAVDLLRAAREPNSKQAKMSRIRYLGAC
ncbi:MAG: hypothetical protein IPI75_17110 [Gammaproteobacteria bacterium]|nr:hypothetical protein [Gammaproteobacteria bacterium]